MATKQYERYIETAYDSGCPKDQVENFLKAKYVSYPWQLNFHAAAREADKENGPTQIGLGGARGPGKSHAVLSQVGLDDVLRQPGLKALFLRQTGSAAKESFEDVIERALRGRVPFEYVNNTLKFDNRSKVILGGFYTERDIDKYVGIEYDLIIIEELNQLTEEKYIKLRGSLRTSKPNWRPRIYASFNPGGIGHGFVKKTFVDPHREGVQSDTRFIPSTYKENPALNIEYVQYLEGLEGDLGKAWREGEWDLFAGQFFSEWRYDTHVVEPFTIPQDWKLALWMDYGHRAPSAVSWVAISPDKQKFIYRELYETGLTYKMLTEEIIARTPDNELLRLNEMVCDPAIWQRKGENDAALSGADIIQGRWTQLMKEKNTNRPMDMGKFPVHLVLKKGNNNREIGWMRFREALKPYLGQEEKPTAELQVFSTCTETIRTIPSLIHDEHKVEDCDCYVRDTLILTPSGEVPVQNLRVGDMVVTPIGNRRVIKAGVSGVSDRVITVYLSNGKKLTGTANHPVMVEGNGLVNLEDLIVGDILMVQNICQVNKLLIKVLFTADKAIGSITNQMELIYQKVLLRYIDKYILIILEKFQRTFMFITKTKTQTITNQQIWYLCLPQNMRDTTNIYRKHKYRKNLESGENQMWGKKHLEIMQKKCVRIRQFDDSSAKIVKILLKLNTLQKFTVNSVSGLKGLLKLFVPSVGVIFCRKKMGNKLHKPVRISAVGNYAKEKVYRLTIEEAHLYYANGVLSHNTDGDDHISDGIRYGLMDNPQPNVTNEVKESILFRRAMKRKKGNSAHKLIYKQ